MERWSDKSHEDRASEDQRRRPEKVDQPLRAIGAQRRVEHEPHRWRRGDTPTKPEEWEVSEFYGSFDDPRP